MVLGKEVQAISLVLRHPCYSLSIIPGAWTLKLRSREELQSLCPAAAAAAGAHGLSCSNEKMQTSASTKVQEPRKRLEIKKILVANYSEVEDLRPLQLFKD